jgi:hypothetical protein
VKQRPRHRDSHIRIVAARALATAAVLVLLPAGTDTPATAATPTVPEENVALTGAVEHAHGVRIGLRVERLALTYERGLMIRIRCRDCRLRRRLPHATLGSTHELDGALLLDHAVLDLTITRAGYNGRWLAYRNAGSKRSKRILEGGCLEAATGRRVACRIPAEDEPTPMPTPPASTPPEERHGQDQTLSPLPEPEAPKPQPKLEPQPEPQPEPANPTAITSVDTTLGDLAPYSGPFEVADQPFTARSNRITYVGVTVANPGVPVGPSSDKLKISICETPECSEGVLASVSAYVNNYGLTTAGMPEVAVEPGNLYYLEWTPPANAHGLAWIAFWHGGAPTIVGSEEMEALVRGYNYTGKTTGGHREIISYAENRPPPAPYSGPFLYAYQPFKAASDTITRLGVVLANPSIARGDEAAEQVTIKLCEAPTCAGVVLATATSVIDNYGVTEASIGNVSVTPGHTYYILWESPRPIAGVPWLTFWLGQGPRPEEASSMQAFAKGYDRSDPTLSAPTIPEQAGFIGASTFRDPFDATGEGPRVPDLGHVQVLCRVFAPQIETAEPDGFWYLLAGEPYAGDYYSPANDYWNGQTPGSPGEPINTDLSVPICSAG